MTIISSISVKPVLSVFFMNVHLIALQSSIVQMYQLVNADQTQKFIIED
jgi:hypothetical protein